MAGHRRQHQFEPLGQFFQREQLALVDAIAVADHHALLFVEDREPFAHELFDLGADLATPSEPPPKWEALRIVDSQVERLEAEIDWMNESLKALDSFILPGGSPLSAHLHLARTVARRAEREAVRLVETGEAVTPAAVIAGRPSPPELRL